MRTSRPARPAEPRSVYRWQLVSATPDVSAGFFRELFGWSISQDNALGYREVKTAEGGIDGGIWPAPQADRPFVQLFVSVPDVDDCLATATRLGATVIVPKSTLPDGDIMAVMLDPSGLPIAVCTPRT
jgi:uncharacterized protein